MTNEDSEILANLFRNVKIYRGLKFHGEILYGPEGMSRKQMLNERFHLGFNDGEDVAGCLPVDIMDVPVSNPVGPAGKLLLHHGAVLFFEHSDHERGFNQIQFLKPGRTAARQVCRDGASGQTS